MGFFSDAEIISLLSMTSVRSAWLIHLDFLNAPMRIWEGTGLLTTKDGKEWAGLGELGTVTGLEAAIGTAAPVANFTLSGVDKSLMAQAVDTATQVTGRDATVYGQFFDDDFKPFGGVFAIWSGIMDQMTYSADGPTDRTINLSVEGLWTRRGRPAFGLYTDRDQRRRYPGDRGLEQVSALINKTVTWPDY